MQAVDDRSVQDFLLQVLMYQLPWFGLWAGSNVFFYKSKILNQDSRNHLVSLIYSVWAIMFACTDLWIERRDLHQANTAKENTFLTFSLSYVLYDFIVNCLYGPMSPNSIISYLLSTVSLLSVLHQGVGAPLLLMGLLIVETSSVLMHFRKILGNIKKRHTALYEVCLLAYIAVFLVIRGIVGSIFNIYATLNREWAPKAFIVVSLLTLAESFTHFKGLFEIFKVCVQHRDQRVENNVALWWWSVNPQLRYLDYYKRMKANNEKHHEKSD
jgi:hypothetical protein